MAAADSVTARIGWRIVRIVLATSNTARTMPNARPPPYQSSEERAMRRASALASSMLSWLIRRISPETVLISRKVS